jgi:hypothetical protein
MSVFADPEPLNRWSLSLERRFASASRRVGFLRFYADDVTDLVALMARWQKDVIDWCYGKSCEKIDLATREVLLEDTRDLLWSFYDE